MVETRQNKADNQRPQRVGRCTAPLLTLLPQYCKAARHGSLHLCLAKMQPQGGPPHRDFATPLGVQDNSYFSRIPKLVKRTKMRGIQDDFPSIVAYG